MARISGAHRAPLIHPHGGGSPRGRTPSGGAPQLLRPEIRREQQAGGEISVWHRLLAHGTDRNHACPVRRARSAGSSMTHRRVPRRHFGEFQPQHGGAAGSWGTAAQSAHRPGATRPTTPLALLALGGQQRSARPWAITER
jgi:hypothetical protein